MQLILPGSTHPVHLSTCVSNPICYSFIQYAALSSLFFLVGRSERSPLLLFSASTMDPIQSSRQPVLQYSSPAPCVASPSRRMLHALYPRLVRWLAVAALVLAVRLSVHPDHGHLGRCPASPRRPLSRSWRADLDVARCSALRLGWDWNQGQFFSHSFSLSEYEISLSRASGPGRGVQVKELRGSRLGIP